MSDLKETAPHWMRVTLLLAAAYNLLWGTWVVLRPNDLFDWAGMQRPLYPSIWQCVGMIVGVYGVGYAVASTNPLRHWPVVLVGFLGKTFGPIGMVYQWLALPADAPERLPTSWMWINVTNDLIWWLPFAAILYLSFKSWNEPAPESSRLPLSQANEDFRSQHGTSLADLSRQGKVLVVFLRHSGCTFCREALDDLRLHRDELTANGTTIAIVHMQDNESTEEHFAHYGLSDVHRFSDPDCQLYRAYELGRGKLHQLFGWEVWWRGFVSAIVNRHGVGKLGGDGFQMPGTFLLQDNKIIKAYRHRHAADRPDYCALAVSDSF